MNPKEWTFTAVFLFLSFPLFSLFRFLFSSWEKGCTLFLHESVPFLPSFFLFSLKMMKQVWSLKTNEGNERRDTKRATDIIIIMKIISFLCLFFPLLISHFTFEDQSSLFFAKEQGFLVTVSSSQSPSTFVIMRRQTLEQMTGRGEKRDVPSSVFHVSSLLVFLFAKLYLLFCPLHCNSRTLFQLVFQLQSERRSKGKESNEGHTLYSTEDLSLNRTLKCKTNGVWIKRLGL